MEYKIAGIQKDHSLYSVLDSPSANSNIVAYLLSQQNVSVRPQWDRIIQSPAFKDFGNLDNSCDLFQTKFPAYIVYKINEYFQKKPKSNYFSQYFSRSENQTQLNSICEAAAFITAIPKQLPSFLLSNDFLQPLIHIALTTCGFSALMSLKSLSNIAENSFESSNILLSMNILPKFLNLALFSNDGQIKKQALFLISSFAKFDHGNELANTIFSFFFGSQITADSFYISLRAFSFLSLHHNHLFNQSVLVNKLFELINIKCNIINSQCFSILTNLVRFNPQILDYLYEIGIFNKIIYILQTGFPVYCINFLHTTLTISRKYDDIVFSPEYINIYENFFASENNENKFKIGKLLSISLANSNEAILLRVFNSNVFSNMLDLIITSKSDPTYLNNIIIGFNRLSTLFGDSSERFFECLSEFDEILQEVQCLDDKDLNILATQFLQMHNRHAC